MVGKLSFACKVVPAGRSMERAVCYSLSGEHVGPPLG